MADTYTIEKIQRIYDDKNGDYLELGPNADALEGLWDLRAVQNDKEFCRLTLNLLQLQLLQRIIGDLVKDNLPPR